MPKNDYPENLLKKLIVRLPGSSSIVKSSARKVRRIENEELAQNGYELLIEANSKWSTTEIWRAVHQAGQVFTPTYYLTALDLEIGDDGGIQSRESARIYVKLYIKTLANRTHYNFTNSNTWIPISLLSCQCAQ